jgi:hypothetical protein
VNTIVPKVFAIETGRVAIDEFSQPEEQDLTWKVELTEIETEVEYGMEPNAQKPP